MTIVSNKDKTIQFSISDKIDVKKEPNMPAIYSLKTPAITCSNIDDALRMQKEINTFISHLVNNIMKEKE